MSIPEGDLEFFNLWGPQGRNSPGPKFKKQSRKSLPVPPALVPQTVPDLPFLAFLEKSKENHPKKQGLFLYAEPLKSLGKKGKTHKKARKFLAMKKARKSKKARKGRSGVWKKSRKVWKKSRKISVQDFFVTFSRVFGGGFRARRARELREGKPGGFQTGGFPLFSGKVRIVSGTPSGQFLVGAVP